MNSNHEKILQAIDKAVAGLTQDQLAHRKPGRWSIADTLEHLSLTFGQTAKMLQRCIDAGKPIGDSPKLKQRLLSAIVVDAGYFPEGRQAPKMVIPSGAMNGLQAVETIRKNLLEMDRLYVECEQKVTQSGWLANHPVLGPLKMKQWPKFHWVHTRHHIKHIERMKNAGQS